MAIRAGRAGHLTPRDEEVMQSIFIARYLSSRQIAAMHFNSFSRGKNRMYDLYHKKGCVDYRHICTIAPAGEHPGKREAVWHLLKQGFDMSADTLDYDGERWTSKQLGDSKARHYIQTNELYVALKNDLDKALGPQPEWLWEHAGRVEDHYEYGAGAYVHQPDAHLWINDKLYIIERQTRESKVTAQKIKDKVEDHKRYSTVILDKAPEEVEVLVACDEQRIAAAANRGGKEHGMSVAADSVEQVKGHLLKEVNGG